MIKILLVGYCGHMGREVRTLLENGYRDMVLTAGVDTMADATMTDTSVRCDNNFSDACRDVDCIVDFSHHSLTHDLLDFAVSARLPLVIATTGQTEPETAAIRAASGQIPIFFSANMSFGIALLIELAKMAAAAMPDAEIEIVEAHHDRKLDAPSGTANMLLRAVTEFRPEAYPVMGRQGQGKRTPNEIGMHSLRMGNVVGMHEVILATGSQIITLKHEAQSRALFAEGALTAAAYVCKKAPGLYTMDDMVKG